MLRVNGAGYAETQDFYSLCDQLGIMVWNEFPKGNSETPNWPQDVYEDQVMHIIFSVRNHPSLALYSGGNEFNPYARGNAVTTGILERSLADFDDTRMFIPTSPDEGDVHTYPDMDPTWYTRIYRFVPFMSETGLLTMPDPQSIRRVVDSRELEGRLGNIFSRSFADSHPEFVSHFMEYFPWQTEGHARQMLARASQIDDMSSPTLDELCAAAQAASGEFLQIVSESLQANYPVTVGFMPWVFNTPWPIEFFMLVDYFGQPVPPYYFLKRTYEQTHIEVRLPYLIWGAGETVPMKVSVIQAPPKALDGLTAKVDVYDTHFHKLWHSSREIAVKPGPSMNDLDLGAFTIPHSLEHQFFLIVAGLRGGSGRLISRSVYWPRCLKRMEEPAFRKKYRSSPQPSLTFEHGPWLRQEVASTRTLLTLELISEKDEGKNLSRIEARVRNSGSVPAFMTHLNITGTQQAFYATANYFWLAPSEERTVNLNVWWHNPKTRGKGMLTVGAWNAGIQRLLLGSGSGANNHNGADAAPPGESVHGPAYQ